MYWKVLNTLDYGIPQSRERVFIIGTLKEEHIAFEWPKKKKMDDVRKCVDWGDTKKDKIPQCIKDCGLLGRIPKQTVFIDMAFKFNNFVNSDKHAPCINTQGNMYVVPLKRRANNKEYLKLQGFPVNFKQVVSKTQMVKQLGNSMSVNVLKEIFKSLLYKL